MRGRCPLCQAISTEVGEHLQDKHLEHSRRRYGQQQAEQQASKLRKELLQKLASGTAALGIHKP